jgi:glycosyltransferase involved in cell wall biosynthesis
MKNKSKKSVLMIRSNLPDIDPRLSKEMDTLLNNDYSVTLLCWDRNKTSKNKIYEKEDYKEIRLRLKSPMGPKIIFFLPVWWIFEFYWLLKLNSDFIHVINLDSVLIPFIVNKIKYRTFFYEMFDLYEDEIVLPKIVRNFLVYIDKRIMSNAEAIIIPDNSRIKEIDGIPNNNIVTIYNSPTDIHKQSLNKSKNENTNSDFKIFYAGTLERHRTIEGMLNVVKSLNNVKLTIAGFGSLTDLVRDHSTQNKNIEFLGMIDYQEVLQRSLSSDLLFSLYDPIIPLNKFASSNKLFEAMMCEKPILVSEGTSMVDIVKKSNCGLVINCKDTEEIKNAIIQLRDHPEICNKLGKNGRSAYNQFYNWEKMQKRILSLYGNLGDI